ncbi:two-component regulator propeller domain-containing protein [Aquimarina sp. 2-A2]|uniref:ligand-binding sensor domain-containing protein n=1 Tax=Aquimarina sp. 2-A2 TaxID=3382644 RepID=UPI00387EF6BA
MSRLIKFFDPIIRFGNYSKPDLYVMAKMSFYMAIGMLYTMNILHAQEEAYKISHYGKQDGLNQSSVNYIFQDSRDFVWIANFGGVNKFDGYSFSSYSNDFGDDTSISDNSVWTIRELSDTSLWFGTKTGLSRYNKTTNNFSNFYILDQDSNSATLAIKALFQDHSGRFYVGSEGQGLFLFSLKSETFTSLSILPKDAKITALTEDTKNNLWVATENLGLFKISANRTEVTAFRLNKSFESKTIWSLYADHKGDVWIGTDTDGLVRFESKADSFYFYAKESKKYSYKAGNKIKTITAQGEEKLWIGSATQGVSQYSYKDRGFYTYQKDPYDINTIYDNDVSSIEVGANGVLYIGFYMKGFDKMISTPFKTLKNNPKQKNTLSNDNVYCMYKDHKNFLWFGTYGGGLNRYDPSTKTFKHYLNNSADPKSISHNWVRIIYEDRQNTLWVGTWGGGLNRFDRETETFKRYLPQNDSETALNHNIITALFEDRDGELWIGTYGGGINLYQPDTDNFISIRHDANTMNSLSDDHITSFYQDDKGLIWICTYGGGLNSYHKQSKTFTRYLPNADVDTSLNSHKTLHIFDTPSQDFLWVTTLGGGLNKFYYGQNKFLNYTEKDGLSNNSTMGMLLDKTGAYWISTNTGLSRFDAQSESFTNYSTQDGLGSDDFNLEAFVVDENDVFYFGGKNGITYFKPEEVVPNTNFPKVAFTNIEVENAKLHVVPTKLEVPYKSRVSFDYAAINPDKMQKIEYAYQLVGRDKDWSDMKNNRHIEFTNLDPGTYELRVRSTNSNKQWNPSYAKIDVKVPTPWFLSWYFRILTVFIIALAAYRYYWVKMNRVKLINRELEQKVKIRTRTIQYKNEALSAEKEKTETAYEKLKTLEQFKNDFTNMLAHDLKNPLVSILGYSSETASHPVLKDINVSGKRMLHLIENMLEVQKFENTNVQLSMQIVNLTMLVEESFKQVEVIANQKNITLEHTISSNVSGTIDPDLVERVLINLLSNAIKFSESGAVVKVFSNVEDTSSERIIIGVQDFGAGIPEDKITAIFSKYTQAEVRGSGEAKSTGLGLAFCKMAIEAHGGKLWVDSNIGKGSIFYFTIPKGKGKVNDQEIKNEHKLFMKSPSMAKLVLENKDYLILKPFIKKINTLEIYETGEWLDIFEKLNDHETQNIKTWKDLMMHALTSFNTASFSHYKNLALDQA